MLEEAGSEDKTRLSGRRFRAAFSGSSQWHGNRRKPYSYDESARSMYYRERGRV